MTCRTTINTAKRAMKDRPAEETNDPLIADHRNFYKVERWMKDGSKVDHMLYAGSALEKARYVFAAAIKHRPRIRLTIRQRIAGAGAVAEPDFVGKVADRRSRVGDLICGLDGDPRDRSRGYVGLAMRRQSDVQGPSLSGGFGPAR